MSQNTLAPPLEQEVAEEAGRDKRVLALAGGLAALVLGTAGFLFLGGGEEELDSGPPPNASRPAAAAAAAPPPVAAVALPAEASVETGRNPFKALYVEPATSTATTTTSGTAVTTPDGGTALVPGATTGTVQYPLTLKSFALPAAGDVGSATFDVDGVQQTVVPNQRFGRSGELVVLAITDVEGQQRVLVQVGDSAPLSFAVGETQPVL